MTPQEADRVIAEYMGWELIQMPVPDTITATKKGMRGRITMVAYSSSLDALIPVWKEMGVDIELDLGENDCRATICTNENAFGYISHKCDNLFSAAAIATAKAIQTLSEPS